MNASKETAKKANAFAYDLQANPQLSPHMREERFKYIREFLDAAERKLPTEASYDRERSRRIGKGAKKYYNAAGDETY